MKFCFPVLILFFLISGSSLFAQKKLPNLVPNPSFEELRNLPLKRTKRPITAYEPTSGYIPFQSNLNYWFKATQTTPDLRITRNDLFLECARKHDDCDKSRTGVRMVGLMTFLRNTYLEDYREYLQVKLKKPLRPDVKTFVELWVSKERNAKLVSNNLGFYFSLKKVFKDTEGPMNIEPQINCDSFINPLKKEWVKIEGNFIPDKPFEYVTIGNFYGNEKTDTLTFEAYTGYFNKPPYAYYLIDDVRIWQENDTTDVFLFDQKEIKINEPFELQNILFQTNKAVLEPSSFIELEKLLKFLEENPELKLEIHGHTDDRGAKTYNLLLSEKRAEAVYRYFFKNGLTAERLKYAGFGEEKPIEAGNSEEARSKNRRAEFYISKKIDIIRD